MWINGRAPEWEPQLASSGLCCEPLHCGIETEPQSFLDAQKQGRSESRHRHRNDRLGVVESWVASSQAACRLPGGGQTEGGLDCHGTVVR
jgi:hypothetical protein